MPIHTKKTQKELSMNIRSMIKYYLVGVIQWKLNPKRDGPYQVVQVYPNGTLNLRKGIYVQRVSRRRCVPYVMAPLEEANVMR
jgi:hypothetical protein